MSRCPIYWVEKIVDLQQQLAALRGRWTTDVPTKSGWYWYRWNGANPKLVELLHAKGDERLYRQDERAYLHDPDSGALSEYAGPLPEPEEEE